MMNFTELTPVPSDHPVPFTDQLQLAVAAYPARFKGSSWRCLGRRPGRPAPHLFHAAHFGPKDTLAGTSAPGRRRGVPPGR